MDQLNYVKLKNNLKHLDLEKQLITTIDQRIKSLPNHNELRLNPELILLVCNLVENAVFDKKTKLKVDKKALVVRVLHSVFNYTEPDKKQVDQHIEFLHANGQIKKVSFAKKCSSIVWDWLSRKFL